MVANFPRCDELRLLIVDSDCIGDCPTTAIITAASSISITTAVRVLALPLGCTSLPRGRGLEASLKQQCSGQSVSDGVGTLKCKGVGSLEKRCSRVTRTVAR